MAPHRGLNLPPTQGTSNAGAFIPGVYKYGYSDGDIEGCACHGFSALRLLVNPASAHDEECMGKLRSFMEAVGSCGILCMFDACHEDDTCGDGHGTGVVGDVSEFAAAWRAVHEVFAEYPDVKYEIFNEPFGYKDVGAYLDEMLRIIDLAALPRERCILDGLGYASDVQAVAKAGWPGLLGYHFYPMWCPEGQRTQENLSRVAVDALTGLSERVHVTEFGGALNFGSSYETYQPDGSGEAANVNALRGFHDALLQLKASGRPVAGAYFFHGWHNGDSYDFWQPENSFGAEKVKKILEEGLADAPADVAGPCTSAVPIFCFRKDEAAYYVHEQHPYRGCMRDWGWSEEGTSFSAWPLATEPGAVAIHTFRKGEAAFYCHAGSPSYGQMVPSGWQHEGVAFFAYPPDAAPESAARVHCFRKGGLAYYCRADSPRFEQAPVWGWQDHGPAFAVPP